MQRADVWEMLGIFGVAGVSVAHAVWHLHAPSDNNAIERRWQAKVPANTLNIN
jgi:hypothetical protein